MKLLQAMSQIRQAEQALMTAIENINARLVKLEERFDDETGTGNNSDGTVSVTPCECNTVDGKEGDAFVSGEASGPVNLVPPPGFIQCFLCAHAARKRKCELCMWREKECAVNASRVNDLSK